MKRFFALIICFSTLVACGQNRPANSTTSDVNSNSVEQTELSAAQMHITGDAPLYAKELLYDLVYGELIYWELGDGNDSLLYRLNLYYENCIIGNKFDEFINLYGTVKHYQRDYLAIPAEIYEKQLCDSFGVTSQFLKDMANYLEEHDVYVFDTYFSKPSLRPVHITRYTEKDGYMTVEYETTYYNDNTHQRIMEAVQTENGWQYTANKYNISPPETEPVTPVSFDKEKLPDIAEALAKHIVEYGRYGSYKLADVTPKNASGLFMTNYIFTFENNKNYNPNYPYTNFAKYVNSSGGDIVYPLNYAQMIAYQLYGFEEWFVPSTDYNSDTMTFSNPTEIGWGFGPTARQISSAQASADKIRVDIFAENVEAEEKYNFIIYFDIITENGCTFLRFSEMIQQ